MGSKAIVEKFFNDLIFCLSWDEQVGRKACNNEAVTALWNPKFPHQVWCLTLKRSREA